MPRGIDTTRVEGLPRGEETSKVTPEGNGMPGADEQGWGGDENSLSTRDTEGNAKIWQTVAIASGQGLAVPPRALQDGSAREIG